MEQFLTIALAHMFAVASPGPDFALVSRQSIKHGRKVAITTSIGIGFGILFHTMYCILGIDVLVNNNSWLIRIWTNFCSFYLLYLGLTSILTKSKSLENIHLSQNLDSPSNKINGFFTGLMTNALNVKATWFFLAIFLHADDASIYLKIVYGLWMSFITILWFVCISIFLTNKKFTKVYNKYYSLINKMMGFILIYIAIKIYLNY